MDTLVERLRERADWMLHYEPGTDDEERLLREAADALEARVSSAAEEGVSNTELPCLVIEEPASFEANLNMRDWVRAAVEAKGAKFTGGGFGADSCDLDIELEGFRYNITITSLPPPPDSGSKEC